MLHESSEITLAVATLAVPQLRKHQYLNIRLQIEAPTGKAKVRSLQLGEIVIPPTLARFALAQAVKQIEAGKYAEAYPLVKSLDARDATVLSVQVHFARGIGLYVMRRFDEAIDWYARIVQSDSSLTEARLGLVLSYTDNGDIESAQQALLPLRSSPDSQITVELTQAYIEERAGRLLGALAPWRATAGMI